jgi:putative glycosyltransferase (TIGR04348 family)
MRNELTKPRPKLVLVTPAAAAANNGNWQTAKRWAHLLATDFDVEIVQRWAGGDAALMIALHARRSAASAQAWREQMGARPLVVVLTGTDLYRDITVDVAAQDSLHLADRLVVLNEHGVAALPPALRGKALVCLQSSLALQPRAKTARHLRALMVGHLREEKSPQTYFEAARLLSGRADIRLDHVGAGLDEALAQQALAQQALALSIAHSQGRGAAHYRWLGALPHGATRRRIAAAHVLVHCSRMEGGAHVVTEAIVSGTPVLASRIDGNLGLLGADYGGYFDWGDAPALARLLERARDDPAMLATLASQCRARAPLFAPEQERRTLLSMVHKLLQPAAS